MRDSPQLIQAIPRTHTQTQTNRHTQAHFLTKKIERRTVLAKKESSVEALYDATLKRGSWLFSLDCLSGLQPSQEEPMSFLHFVSSFVKREAFKYFEWLGATQTQTREETCPVYKSRWYRAKRLYVEFINIYRGYDTHTHTDDGLFCGVSSGCNIKWRVSTRSSWWYSTLVSGFCLFAIRKPSQEEKRKRKRERVEREKKQHNNHHHFNGCHGQVGDSSSRVASTHTVHP